MRSMSPKINNITTNTIEMATKTIAKKKFTSTKIHYLKRKKKSSYSMICPNREEKLN